LSGGAERWVMNLLRNPLCAISGRESSANQLRFLIAENSWEDKLTILRWNESIASRPGIKAACSIEHVEELVIHWMTTGRLDYPFARTSHGVGGWRHASPLSRTDLSGARSIAELAVHRESLERVLIDGPSPVSAGHSGCTARCPASGDRGRSGTGFTARGGTRRRKRVVRGLD